jgi:hypothetical protein
MTVEHPRLCLRRMQLLLSCWYLFQNGSSRRRAACSDGLSCGEAKGRVLGVNLVSRFCVVGCLRAYKSTLCTRNALRELGPPARHQLLMSLLSTIKKHRFVRGRIV